MQAVLFDFDGVLSDTAPAINRVASLALGAGGIAIDEEEYGKRFDGIGGNDWRVGLERLHFEHGIAISCIEIDRLQAAISEAAVSATAFLPGMNDLWNRVSVRRGIVSSCPGEELRRKVAKLGIRDVAVMVAGEDVPRVKPWPEPYLLGALELGIEASECIVIEDSAAGITSAKAAGAFSILFSATHKSKCATAKIIELTNPDFVAKSSKQLIDILHKMKVIG